MEFIYRAIDDGGHKNDVEAAEERVGYVSSKHGEKIGHTEPSVYILNSSGVGLLEFFSKVRDEVTSQTIECKSLCNFNNCKKMQPPPAPSGGAPEKIKNRRLCVCVYMSG